MADAYRLRNLVHTAILLGGMAALIAAIGWIFAGPVGIAWAVGLGTILLIVATRASPTILLRLYNARPIAQQELPDLYAILAELAERARLPRVPRLIYIPSRMIQAFTVHLRRGPAIAITDGLLRGLEPREIAAVLAHEIAHVRHGDIRIMTIADVVTKLTRSFAFAGMVLVFVNLPLYLVGGAPAPWIAILLMIAAPTISVLLQLALSRAREYDADHTAVELSGDPEALASALVMLERYQGRMWEQMVMPGYRLPEPSLLRSHPATADRLARLAAMPAGPPLRTMAQLARSPSLRAAVARGPRWSPFGYWF